MSGFGSSGWGGKIILTSGGGGGPSSPLISNLTPVDGSQISPAQAIEFDVTSDVAVVLVVVSALYLQTGASEAIWTGEEFAPNFALSSSRLPIARGYHYIVKRRGGWPLSPTLDAHMADANGNTAKL